MPNFSLIFSKFRIVWITIHQRRRTTFAEKRQSKPPYLFTLEKKCYSQKSTFYSEYENYIWSALLYEQARECPKGLLTSSLPIRKYITSNGLGNTLWGSTDINRVKIWSRNYRLQLNQFRAITFDWSDLRTKGQHLWATFLILFSGIPHLAMFIAHSQIAKYPLLDQSKVMAQNRVLEIPPAWSPLTMIL